MAKKETAPWPVTLQPWSDGKRWTALGLAPRFSKTAGRWMIPLPAFRSDLASVPAVARGVVSVWGLHGLAALYHDLLYRHKLPGITRKMADRIMLEFMEEDGVGYFKRRAIYAAVRLGGKRAWNE